MEPSVIVMLSGVGIVCGLMGWSYSTLSKQLDALQITYHEKLDSDAVRQVVDDKLAVCNAKLDALNSKLDYVINGRQIKIKH